MYAGVFAEEQSIAFFAFDGVFTPHAKDQLIISRMKKGKCRYPLFL
jgi:hypothetical protein